MYWRGCASGAGKALADGIVDSAVVARTESIRPAEKQDADISQRHNDAITRAVAFAARQLGQRKWCEDIAITLADLALVSALLYLDLRQAERDWRGAHPNLAAWLARVSERASFRGTLVT